MALYHAAIGFPQHARIPDHWVRLRYGRHAREAAQTDRYGRITLPNTLDFSKAELVEVEVLQNGVCAKVVARTRYDDSFDLVLVVNLDGFVRTVWLNSRTDAHRTLDASRYARP